MFLLITLQVNPEFIRVLCFSQECEAQSELGNLSVSVSLLSDYCYCSRPTVAAVAVPDCSFHVLAAVDFISVLDFADTICVGHEFGSCYHIGTYYIKKLFVAAYPQSILSAMRWV